ncbi:MAG TPA: hypothetical protein VL325_01330 [Pyrinomonadaceae bacterium]|jgi:hypothetical protein|nr:hypothetical protein [Pyrinomonadaceae bacterium]
MAINESAIRRNYERRLFLIAAILFALIVLIGFGPTYYFKEFFHTPPLASVLVHVHGLLMTTWVALFATQVWLIRSKNIKIHQKLGLAAIGLAITIVVVGFFVAVHAAKYGGGTPPPPGFPRLSFLAIPMFDLVMFALLFGAAVYYRKQAANHKRLMILTALNFFPPALARIHFSVFDALGPLAFFGIPAILAIGLLIYDTRRNGKLNKVFLAGAMLLIASYPLRIAISGTDAWTSFATWLTTWAA